MRYLRWNTLRLLMMMLLVVFLFSFATKKNDHRKIKKIDIEILDNNVPFLTTDMVNKLLIEKNNNPKTITKETLVLNKLENTVNKHQLVEKAQVFVSVDGVLKVKVVQKMPLARVINEYESFYLDYEADRMPYSNNYSARVPIISGNLSSVQREKLALVLRNINEDEFLKKNIIGIQILPNGSLTMKNRSHHFNIDFGRAINVERKFENYKAFYQKALQDKVLDNYKTITLKFTQQVVCIK